MYSISCSLENPGQHTPQLLPGGPHLLSWGPAPSCCLSSSRTRSERKPVTLGHGSSCPWDNGPLLNLGTGHTCRRCRTGQCRNHPGSELAIRSQREHPGTTGFPCALRRATGFPEPAFKKASPLIGTLLTSHSRAALPLAGTEDSLRTSHQFKKRSLPRAVGCFAWDCSAVFGVQPGHTGAVMCRTEPCCHPIPSVAAP